MSITLSVEIQDSFIEVVTAKAVRHTTTPWLEEAEYDSIQRRIDITVNEQYVAGDVQRHHTITHYQFTHAIEQVIDGSVSVRNPAVRNDIVNATRDDAARQNLDNEDANHLLQYAAFGELKWS